MDRFGHADVRTLTDESGGDPHVSIFMPTHQFGAGVAGDQLRWKTLVDGAESALRPDLRRPDLENLLAPARELERDSLAWQHMGDGLAMFLRPGGHHTFRLPIRLPKLVTIGDHPAIGPLLPMLSGDEQFFLLAVSQRDVRLMHGTRHAVEQMDLPVVPTSLRDVVETPEGRTETMARSAIDASRGGPAIFYGHGAFDENIKQENLHRFLRKVSDGLGEVLSQESAPMVLVGLERLVGAYREVNTYPHVLDEAVLHNADELTPEQLHARAWPIVDRRIREEHAEVIGRFRALHGTGRASTNPEIVRDAAGQGRVETLFVPKRPSCWDELVADGPNVVRLGSSQRTSACERLDAIAIDTLTAGGQVHTVSGALAPGDELAAIFRY